MTPDQWQTAVFLATADNAEKHARQLAISQEIDELRRKIAELNQQLSQVQREIATSSQFVEAMRGAALAAGVSPERLEMR